MQKSPISTSNYVNPQDLKDSKSFKINPNDYGMDLNSDDSTDDESQPRKPIPPWATGHQLNEAVTYQYYNPPDIDTFFGPILSPKLEDIFYKSKPRKAYLRASRGTDSDTEKLRYFMRQFSGEEH
ncbi:UNVERIFIED_CONTAM: hypothetical protein K2H54_062711 [Gekko kuhli]